MSFKLLPAEGTVVRRAKAQALLATANATLPFVSRRRT
jgi:hypothetical protein